MTNKGGLPEGVSFDSETNTISGTPTKVGSHPITVTTTDAEGNATTTNLRLKSTPQNRRYQDLNTAIDSITVEATDNSGQAVTNKVSGYQKE